MFASEKGNVRSVKALLSALGGNEVKLEAQNQKGKTALMLACQEGHSEIVKEILLHSHNSRRRKGRDLLLFLLGQVDDKGDTPLLLACKNKRPKVVKVILEIMLAQSHMLGRVLRSKEGGKEAQAGGRVSSSSKKSSW